jgi:DNA-binding response OmpR family regulator
MNTTQGSLLVVEDDDATRDFLAENLAADGFTVATASEPGEAVRAIELRRPDLVLLDLLLSGGHGLAVLDRVRAADGLGSRLDPQVPVIVVSGRGAEIDRVRGFARGADDYVVKPSLLVVRATRRNIERPASSVR